MGACSGVEKTTKALRSRSSKGKTKEQKEVDAAKLRGAEGWSDTALKLKQKTSHLP